MFFMQSVLFPFVSFQLQEIIQNGLEGNEYVSLLSWTLNTYKGDELLGHPDLKNHTANLGPLLPPKVLNRLQEEYLMVLHEVKCTCHPLIISF